MEKSGKDSIIVGKNWWKVLKVVKNTFSAPYWYMKWGMSTFWAQKIARKNRQNLHVSMFVYCWKS